MMYISRHKPLSRGASLHGGVLKMEIQSDIRRWIRTDKRRDWSAYRLANENEYIAVCDYLSKFLDLVVREPKQTIGRPRASLKDIIFCLIIKAYMIRSGHRIISMLDDLEEKGFISAVPKRSTLMRYLKEANLTPILEEILQTSSLPFSDHETIFAIDSSGFSIYSSNDAWVKVRTKKPYVKKAYRKAHICIGVNSGIISAAKITTGTANDSPFMGTLLDITAKNFQVLEVLGDKAYCSRGNYKLIQKIGAIGYIPFRSNYGNLSKGSPQFGKQFRLYLKHRGTFDLHYHLRSNVEASFSASKRKFGHFVLGRIESTQDNEVLCKLIVHNICILIYEVIKGDVEFNWNFIDRMSI